MSNIVLIGMPGAGKSTSGILAAKGAGMSFTDTDLLIQEKAGMILQDVIDKQGIEAFLDLEESVLSTLSLQNHIIATGGSAVYSEKSMTHLKKNSSIIYLQADIEEIERRLDNITTRGIAVSDDKTIRQLALERTPLYEKYADSIIRCTTLSTEEAAGAIIKRIQRVYPVKKSI